MKYLKYLLLMIPFMFISSVKAESIELNNSNSYTSDMSVQELFTNKDYKGYLEELGRLLFEKYESDYSDIYPFYVIEVGVSPSSTGFYINLSMVMSNQKFSFNYKKGKNNGYGYNLLEDNTELGGNPINEKWQNLEVSYNSSSTTYNLPELKKYISPPAHYAFNVYVNSDSSSIPTFNSSFLVSSNFDLMFYTDYDSVIINNYLDSGNTYTLKNGDILPTIYKGKDFNNNTGNLVEVDLNSYPYIALSLKDYSKTEAFDSTVYVKGQLCITPAYEYGLKSYDDVVGVGVSNICSLYYEDYTPTRFTLTNSNLINHSIYYLKAYDTSKENKVKIDTSVFNIHYITEEEKDNPILTINGKKYSVIPFDDLPTNANKNTEEGYVPGGSCAVGDLNCTASMMGSDFKWSDIFTSPLDFIKGIWSSVTQVFIVIGYFISLLPIQLQYFLYISFMLAIILGLLKIIL